MLILNSIFTLTEILGKYLGSRWCNCVISLISEWISVPQHESLDSPYYGMLWMTSFMLRVFKIIVIAWPLFYFIFASFHLYLHGRVEYWSLYAFTEVTEHSFGSGSSESRNGPNEPSYNGAITVSRGDKDHKLLMAYNIKGWIAFLSSWISLATGYLAFLILQNIFRQTEAHILKNIGLTSLEAWVSPSSGLRQPVLLLTSQWTALVTIKKKLSPSFGFQASILCSLVWAGAGRYPTALFHLPPNANDGLHF